MSILSKPLRRQLETAIRQAREIAEEAGQDAIARIGVADTEAPSHLTEDNKALRRRLRAHGRTLGDTRDDAGTMTTVRLQDAVAYEIWHRMLFGRFLVERGLLIHPDIGAAISVAELRELAEEEGAADEWALAERYAAPGLPGVFKPDDPVLALPVAPEFSKRLRTVLSSLPEDVFIADDSLGWTYQFWRASEKDAVNRAGGKIGAAELPAVTQLFTESYMVKFLLHNTLGAWWAGKVLAADSNLASNATDEDALRVACALPGLEWEFLRFARDDGRLWRPAAGTFPGWPDRAAEITYCDPCCGSGHFLVEAFAIFSALRQREECLDAKQAAVAVLSDNLHGLELDGRCVQIAAFNVALAAWKLAGEPIALPSPHIAWIGAPPPMSQSEMAALADGDPVLRRALETLHDQFMQAPVLGSLLQVGARDLLDADLRERGDAALVKLRGAEPERAEGAVAARGLLDASALLTRRYTLLATNVPFLGRGKQNDNLADYIAREMPDAKADLATALLQRMSGMVTEGGAIASVTPQNWLFLSSYKSFRQQVLSSDCLSAVAMLGEHGFESSSAAGAFTALLVMVKKLPNKSTHFFGLDASGANDIQSKRDLLKHGDVTIIRHETQISNPDSRVMVDSHVGGTLLASYATASHGQGSFDSPRFSAFFWEVIPPSGGWVLQQSTPTSTDMFSGNQFVFRWENGVGSLATMMRQKHDEGYKSAKWRAGVSEWGKRGILCGQMRNLPCTTYLGFSFDDNASVIMPLDQENLSAIWSFCSSRYFSEEVRKIDRKLNVTCKSLVKIPFDIDYWKSVAEKDFGSVLPEPYSDEPAQWLFHGHPAFAAAGTELHVALARLAGYRWPAENDTTLRLSDLAMKRIALAADLPSPDADGLLPLHAYGSGVPLADRLRAFLAASYGELLSASREQALVRASDVLLDKKRAKDDSLEGWLADRAFRQHCVLFNQRPFLWQVWDGMKDGFSAFLHYHRLDRSALDKLTYTLLGDWIRNAKAEGNTARQERAERLQQVLAEIIEGEKPFDIFVRWKPFAEQPIGWEPDLNDGVRLNIRPFMSAGILREQPKGISWNKDRGTDVVSAPWFDLGLEYGGKQGDRINDHHITLAEKRAVGGGV